MRVESRAPARVDLAGGTVDIWPLYLFHPGAQTVNIAIRNYASSVVETRSDRRIVLISRDQKTQESFQSLSDLARGQSSLPLVRELVLFFEPRRGVTVETASEVPAGAGLGGSSALNIALCGALARVTGKRYLRSQLLEIAKNVEAIVIQVPTGWQDYFPALYGGASAVHLGCDGVRRENLPVSSADLEEHFVLCYTGLPRNSAINNWEVMKAHIDADPKVRRNFSQITAIATRMREALLAHDWNDVAKLTRKHGTLAAKVCGAGGGGCVVFLVEAGAKSIVESELVRMGGQIINFAVSRTGLEVRSEDSEASWESGRTERW